MLPSRTHFCIYVLCIENNTDKDRRRTIRHGIEVGVFYDQTMKIKWKKIPHCRNSYKI